ncbi:DUF397 domain-containing protein [Trebonia sp.]|uniref:DUF397 domain-containing protein n=1 Tax=Trebonia sp. TaxID=2767075 RepID=UPI002623C3F0|nr:DUF397 domain-containing protein [Trebonia sp.]
MDQDSAATWRKSSYSGTNGGDCVEAGAVPGAVLVRDTKDRAGAVLAFGPQVWREFAAKVEIMGRIGSTRPMPANDR